MALYFLDKVEAAYGFSRWMQPPSDYAGLIAIIAEMGSGVNGEICGVLLLLPFKQQNIRMTKISERQNDTIFVLSIRFLLWYDYDGESER